MKKATKGALAAAAAGSLLLGGAGSLAYWTGTGTITGSSINSGEITMAAPVCADNTTTGTHGWKHSNGDAVTKVVPGDTVTKVCDITLTTAGDHIEVKLGLGSATIATSATDTLDTELTPSVAFTDVTNPAAPVAVANNAVVTGAGTHVYRATVTVVFNGASATDGSQGVSAALNDITLTATQNHA